MLPRSAARPQGSQEGSQEGSLPGWPEGWAGDAHAEAFAAYRRSAEALVSRGRSKGARLKDNDEAALLAAAEAALALGDPGDDAARRFFETWFTPRVLNGGDGFVTAYYEPVVEASPVRTDRFSAPILRNPSDLVRLGAPGTGELEGFEWARRVPGGLSRHLRRGEVMDGALDEAIEAEGLAIAWTDPVDAFYVHIQGSARLRLPEGEVRVTFSGKTGHPYTAIGRVLLDEGALAPGEADMAAIRAWFAAHPDETDRVLRQNASYIFFDTVDGLDSSLGPIGADGVPLTPHRSIAVDRTRHAFGLPVWVEADLPHGAWARLCVGQDTGSAIQGDARADLFLGSGEEAGRLAGPVAHPARLTVLWPRRAPSGSAVSEPAP